MWLKEKASSWKALFVKNVDNNNNRPEVPKPIKSFQKHNNKKRKKSKKFKMIVVSIFKSKKDWKEITFRKEITTSSFFFFLIWAFRMNSKWAPNCWKIKKKQKERVREKKRECKRTKVDWVCGFKLIKLAWKKRRQSNWNSLECIQIAGKRILLLWKAKTVFVCFCSYLNTKW